MAENKFDFEETFEETAENEVLKLITIKCIGCGEEFTMIPSEQKFYKAKGYELPKRCAKCRASKNKTYSYTCVDCGAEFTLDGREVDYFKLHGLEIPKRCKQCRSYKKERNVNFKNEEKEN